MNSAVRRVMAVIGLGEVGLAIARHPSVWYHPRDLIRLGRKICYIPHHAMLRVLPYLEIARRWDFGLEDDHVTRNNRHFKALSSSRSLSTNLHHR
jgi:hypothetical protein